MVPKMDQREDDRQLQGLEKEALMGQNEQQIEVSTDQATATSTSSGQVKYLVAVSLALLYFLVPLPAVFNAGNYLSASSSSALSSLLDFSFSSSAPCHHGHGSSDDLDSFSLHGKGYRAIFGHQHKNRDSAFYAKGRPSLHTGPRDHTYNSKIEQAFLKVPNNESCIAASRR